MRRTDDLIDTAGGSDLPKSEEDEAVDRISGLPKEVRLHILSFLPFRCAVRASLMLRPFRGLWRYLSSLSLKDYDYRYDFHTCDPSPSESGGDRLWNFVDHVLALHESPEIHTFQIVVGSYAGVNSSRDRLHEWISFALKKKVKALDVNLLMYRHPGGSQLARCSVPSAVFTTSSLVELHLSVPNVEFGEQIHEEVMRKLILGSPSLKKVSLRNCSGLRVLKIDRHPSLEELNVRQCRVLEEVDLASSGIKILAVFILKPINKIICPNVSTLELEGPKLDGVNLETGSSLNDVALYFHRSGNFFLEEGDTKTLMEKLRNITSFSLSNRIMLVFTRWKLMNEPRRSFNWKSVTMILHLAKRHLPGISYVLETCNFLETLTIYVFPSHNDIEVRTRDL
ncbi:hypothetical protein EUGRSUZ_K01152 [Eucalyptus grandis]|uniref:Uncharacterized protein n=2 Tax=Eucalyptus grandis TaxID=71139 RepID=A0ACC3ITT2_EUCGR|nr:hypothetical protein EUGRSUZ_K01152 [Eucalyptus grandis]